MTPTEDEGQQLSQAGLGMRRVSLLEDAEHSQVGFNMASCHIIPIANDVIVRLVWHKIIHLTYLTNLNEVVFHYVNMYLCKIRFYVIIYVS